VDALEEAEDMNRELAEHVEREGFARVEAVVPRTPHSWRCSPRWRPRPRPHRPGGAVEHGTFSRPCRSRIGGMGRC